MKGHYQLLGILMIASAIFFTAYPTAADQITDSVTQVNTKVLGDSADTHVNPQITDAVTHHDHSGDANNSEVVIFNGTQPKPCSKWTILALNCNCILPRHSYPLLTKKLPLCFAPKHH